MVYYSAIKRSEIYATTWVKLENMMQVKDARPQRPCTIPFIGHVCRDTKWIGGCQELGAAENWDWLLIGTGFGEVDGNVLESVLMVMHHVNVLTELYTLKWWILYYVNYVSIFKNSNRIIPAKFWVPSLSPLRTLFTEDIQSQKYSLTCPSAHRSRPVYSPNPCYGQCAILLHKSLLPHALVSLSDGKGVRRVISKLLSQSSSCECLFPGKKSRD